MRAFTKDVTLADLTEEGRDGHFPLLDQPEIDETLLTDDQRDWRTKGLVVLKNFLPDDLMDAYCRVREKLNRPGGWDCDTPYMHVQELRDLALFPPLMFKMKELIGDDMGLHLNLTGWVSTQRNWHQDDYLNPPSVRCWYTAVWMALDDIDPRSGPFEFVRGSHKWPLMRQDKLFTVLTDEMKANRAWPGLTQGVISALYDQEIHRRRVWAEHIDLKRGDVIVWHGALVHRGSLPQSPGMPRKSLISHYSGINHRPDMPVVAEDQNGQAYFPFKSELK